MDCCKTLGNIEKQCGGGVAPGLTNKAIIGCTEKMICWPECEDGSHISSSTIFAESFFTWHYNNTASDANYVAEPQGDEGDQGWATSVTFFMPKLNPLTTYILNNTANGDFWMVIQDKCGQKRFLGDPICGGVSIKVNEQTNDKNGYSVTATWETSTLPCYFTGDIIETPIPVITPE